MAVRVQVDAANVLRRLDSLNRRELPALRRDLVDETARSVLSRTIERNPVDTARSRAGWVTGLQMLGGTPPSAWRGPSPESHAIAEGQSRGTASRNDTSEQTEISATNSVTYVNYLEFGTRSRQPIYMAWRSLLEASRSIGARFALLWNRIAK